MECILLDEKLATHIISSIISRFGNDFNAEPINLDRFQDHAKLPYTMPSYHISYLIYRIGPSPILMIFYLKTEFSKNENLSTFRLVTSMKLHTQNQEFFDIIWAIWYGLIKIRKILKGKYCTFLPREGFYIGIRIQDGSILDPHLTFLSNLKHEINFGFLSKWRS